MTSNISKIKSSLHKTLSIELLWFKLKMQSYFKGGNRSTLKLWLKKEKSIENFPVEQLDINENRLYHKQDHWTKQVFFSKNMQMQNSKSFSDSFGLGLTHQNSTRNQTLPRISEHSKDQIVWQILINWYSFTTLRKANWQN
jgi:hypothetical protein